MYDNESTVLQLSGFCGADAAIVFQSFKNPMTQTKTHTHTHWLLSTMMRSLLVTGLYCMNRQQLRCPFSSSLEIGGLYNPVYTYNMYCVSVNSRNRCSHMVNNRKSSFYCSHTLRINMLSLTFRISQVRFTSQLEENGICLYLQGFSTLTVFALESFSDYSDQCYRVNRAGYWLLPYTCVVYVSLRVWAPELVILIRVLSAQPHMPLITAQRVKRGRGDWRNEC